MLLKLTKNQIILEETFKISFSPTIIQQKTPIQDNHLILPNNLITPKPCSFFPVKIISTVSFHTIPLKFKDFCTKPCFSNRRNRRSRRVESQSSDRDQNPLESSFTQGNATLVVVFENVNTLFNRNLGSELTEPSQISNEMEAISQRLSEQNNNKMTQIEQQLKNIFEEKFKRNQNK